MVLTIKLIIEIYLITKSHCYLWLFLIYYYKKCGFLVGCLIGDGGGGG